MTQTEIPFSKPRLFLVGLIGLCLPLTLWAAIHFASANNWTDAGILLAVSVPLSVIDFWVWRRLLTDRPAVILTDDALIDQSSFFAAGCIQRARIADFRAGSTGSWRGVVIDLRDTKGRYGRKSTIILTFPLGRSPDALAYDLSKWLREGTRY
jgi:hypothetical protein